MDDYIQSLCPFGNLVLLGSFKSFQVMTRFYVEKLSISYILAIIGGLAQFSHN